jgi:hypothetical protein
LRSNSAAASMAVTDGGNVNSMAGCPKVCRRPCFGSRAGDAWDFVQVSRRNRGSRGARSERETIQRCNAVCEMLVQVDLAGGWIAPIV